MAGPAQRAAAGGERIFTRKTSGLLRTAGAWDTFIFNIGLVSVGIAIALNQYYGPSLYPGAQVWLSTVLAGVGMVFTAATFYLWSITFPRSGGVYVSLSRSYGPGLAFVFTAVEVMILTYYAALASSLIVTVGLSSFFGTIGVVSGNTSLVRWAAAVASPQGIFWLGSLFLVLAGLLLAIGTRVYFSVQKVLFVVAILGTLIIFIVLLFGSRETFQANLTALTGLAHDDVIAKAKAAGWAPAPFTWHQTVAFLVWPLLPLLGAVQSIGIGGEIKRVNRAQLLGMFGATIVSVVLIALFAILSDKTFGYEFQGAVAFNSLNGVAGGSIEGVVGAAPWFTVLAGILTNSFLVTIIIMLAFVAWIWFWVPAELAYTTRTMIAWSFDGIAPEGLGHVSDRLHTPVVAIALSTAIAIVFMALIAFAKIALLTLIEVLLVIWGAVMLAAVFFPIRSASLFAMSPASQIRIAGLPLMSITGLISAVFFLWTIVTLWNDANAAGPLISAGGARLEFWIVLGTVLAALAWYVFIKAERKRQGIDLDRAFKEIPIE